MNTIWYSFGQTICVCVYFPPPFICSIIYTLLELLTNFKCPAVSLHSSEDIFSEVEYLENDITNR